jgi:glycosyltransferase involved in cell wall biosynthesis
LSVIIPAWNAGKTIVRCLDAVRRQSLPPLETIVVDDGSLDDTAVTAESMGVRVLRLTSNEGPAKARNRGAEAARGDAVLFLDADVVVPEDLVEKVARHLENDSVSAVQTLYTPDCPGEGLVTRYQNFYYHYSLCRVRHERVAVFATWCAAVRREVFLGLGGFNECIPEPTVEDEELGYAIVDSGGCIIMDRSLQVVHLAEYGFSGFARRRLRMAKAQAKSGWRQVRQRLLARYMNVRDTGTHHSRWVVLSIVLTLAAWAFTLFPPLVGNPLPAFLLLPAALGCHSGFFVSAGKRFGARVLPGFAVMCLADMTILGLGIARGTLEYMFGRKY